MSIFYVNFIFPLQNFFQILSWNKAAIQFTKERIFHNFLFFFSFSSGCIFGRKFMKQFWVDVLGRGAYYKQPVFFASEKNRQNIYFSNFQNYKIFKKIAKIKHLDILNAYLSYLLFIGVIHLQKRFPVSIVQNCRNEIKRKFISSL